MVAPRFATAWLLGAGALLLGSGVAGIIVGTWLPGWLYRMLPPVTIDVAAVGGAATASGVALLLLGTLHVGAATGLRRGQRSGALLTAVVVLAMTMAALCVGWGLAALVSVVAGDGPAGALVPAGIGLAAAAIGYGWTAAAVSRLREPPSFGI